MRKAIVIPVGIVAVLGAAYLGAIAYIPHRAIEDAAAEGVTLTIASTSLGISGVTFTGVTATTVQAPNAKIYINDITSDWRMSLVVANGGDVTIDGPLTPPNAKPSDNPVPKFIGGPDTISVHSAHILWTHAAGDTTIEFTDVNGTLAPAPEFRQTYTWTANVGVTFAGRPFGPFYGEFSHLNGEEILTLAADPVDKASEELTVSNFALEGPHRYDLSIQDRPLSKIGIPINLFGFALTTDPKIKLHVNDSINRPVGGAAHGNGLVQLSTDPITVPNLPDPASLSFQLAWSGNPDQPMPISDAAFSVGPFSGPVTGTITRPEGATAVDLAFVSKPVPCTKFAAASPLGSLLGSSPLSAIAAFTGTKSAVTGDVKLNASVQFDSRNPGARHISFTPENTCGLSISLGSGQN